MADSKHPYTSGANGLITAVGQLRKSFPAKVTADTLKKLGIAPNNETYIINILRFLGVIDTEGNRNQKAASVLVQHEESAFQSGFSEIVQTAYHLLFELHGPDAWSAPIDKLISFFRNSDHTSDIVGRRQATTFQALAALSGKLDSGAAKSTQPKPRRKDPVALQKKTKISTAPRVDPDGTATENQPVVSRQLDATSASATADVALTVRIEINLPAGGDKETYDNIFKSIRENLIHGKVT